MMKGRQDAAFLIEPPQHLVVGIFSKLDQFDGDVASKGAVHTVCQVNTAHAASTNEIGNLVGPDVGTDEIVDLAGVPCFKRLQLLVEAQQLEHFVSQDRLVGKRLPHERFPGLRRIIQRSQEGFASPQVMRIHACFFWPVSLTQPSPETT